MIKRYFLGLVFGLVVFGLLFWSPSVVVIDENGFYDVPFDKELFDKGVENLDTSVENTPIVAGVVPHHLLAGQMIADFFYRVSLQNPKTIVLIGPNHQEMGDGDYLSSDMGFDTEFGKVEIDYLILDELITQDVVVVDNEVMSQEHSIVELMTFFKYFLPDTKIVSIAVSNFTPKDKIEQFVESVNKVVGNDVLLVGSLDFSHYLNTPEAIEKDEITLKAINSSDIDLVLSFNNDYVDSPVVLASMLLFSEGRDVEIWGHENSGDILGNIWVETTSYFTLGWSGKILK